MAVAEDPEVPKEQQATEDALLEQHMRSLSRVRDPALRFLAEELLAQLQAIRHANGGGAAAISLEE